MRYILIVSVIVLSFVKSLDAQLAIGQWRTHLPYYYGTSVAEVGNLVYCGTQDGLYSYNRTTGDMKTYSKVNGFSGVGVSLVGYNEHAQCLMIIYDDANIDLLKGDEIVNMSDIKDYTIQGAKTIHAVTMKGDSAILSCAFGVVVIDVKNEVVKTDVKFSDNVSFAGVECYDAAFYTADTSYYFATTGGLYRVKANQNIKNLQNWYLLPGVPVGTYNSVVAFGNKVYFNYSHKLTASLDNQDTVYVYNGSAVQYLDMGNTKTLMRMDASNTKLALLFKDELRGYNTLPALTDQISLCFNNGEQAIPGATGNFWVAADYGGFYEVTAALCNYYTPDGPKSRHTYDMHITSDGNIWVAPGAVTQTWANTFNFDGLFYRRDNDWKSVPLSDYGGGTTHWDVITLAVDPNDPGHIIAGSWGMGMYEVTGYSNATGTYGSPFESTGGFPYKIGGVLMDEDGNYWVSNVGNAPLKKRLASGTWIQYSFTSVTGGSVTSSDPVGCLEIDDLNQIWMAVYNKGIIVMDIENPGNRRLLNGTYNYGDLPDLKVRCIRKDLNGEIWIGCENGIRTFSAGQVLPSSNAINAQKIVLKAEDGNNELLLAETVINDIEVDGANRKWIATQGNGVRLVSEDGRTILLSFTAENSPLLSNNVNTIAIDNKTGEVYFGTEKGIISYKSDATIGSDSFGDVYAYPNPVKPEYDGPIVITGMANDALVKITDIAGNLVYETQSLGGQAVWNGKRYDGQRPQTGVYLVFCVNQDASETVITKILFIN